jgi:diguanylate cyclase (GGDEF)-like protein
VSTESAMLVLADRRVGEELAAHLGNGRCARVGEPYEALEAMGRRRWPAVVLTAPRADFAGLCRASRRLQRNARLFAVCGPAAEPDVRPLLGRPLDDYFIYPLGRRELVDLRRAAETTRPPAGGEAAAAPADAPGRWVAELVASGRSVAELESRLAEAVGSLVGAPVAWVEGDAVPAGAEPLLRADGDAPRVLVAQEALRRAEGAAAYLAAVRPCLPDLLAAARRTESLYRLAVTDHLTGAYNRRYFYHLTEQILGRAQRERFRVTLLLYDIDNFKRYNDTYGHAAGDEILRDAAALMKQITRSQDIVARIGGDEFTVLFWDGEEPRVPNSRPPESAYALADRFRLAVQNHEFGSLGPEAKGTLTISGGLASFPRDGQSVRELLRAADSALRKAKESGKNAIFLIGRE